MLVLLSLGFSIVKNKVHHFFFSAKLPLGHASVSSNHNNTAFPCFHKGFKFCLSCAKALCVPLKTINEAIPTVGLTSNCTHHPANSWNAELSSANPALPAPGNTFIILSPLLTPSPLQWASDQWIHSAFPSMKCCFAGMLWIPASQISLRNPHTRIETLTLEFLHP